MSGIYIPGVEKSKTCAFCRFCDGLADTQLGSCAFCVVDGKTRVADTPPKDCPLVPVPKHGDLIDRDKLEKDIDNYIGGEESRSRFHHWVQVQSVVIPGNKGEQT